MISLTEGNYDEDRDFTELDIEDWGFDDEKKNNLILPSKIRRDLKNSIIKCITNAKKKYSDLKSPNIA